jgi:hypothetical protein
VCPRAFQSSFAFFVQLTRWTGLPRRAFHVPGRSREGLSRVSLLSMKKEGKCPPLHVCTRGAAGEVLPGFLPACSCKVGNKLQLILVAVGSSRGYLRAARRQVNAKGLDPGPSSDGHFITNDGSLHFRSLLEVSCSMEDPSWMLSYPDCV